MLQGETCDVHAIGNDAQARGRQMMQRFKMTLHHVRDGYDQRRAPLVLSALHFRQFPITAFAPEPNLPPLRDAAEVLLPERDSRTAMRMDNIRVPSDPHVVHNVEAQAGQPRRD